MTSNIDKLNLIAPLLVGRHIGVEYRDAVGRTLGSGLFHSLEIDNVYPDSEPTVYFRMTDVIWERYRGLPEHPLHHPVLEWENKVGDEELVFPISRLSMIDLKWGSLEGFIVIWFQAVGDEPSAQLVFVDQ
ncbi:MAG: hypothetical protein ABIR46_03195 [Candidatus Saccharimonadales bacterium]